MANGEGRAYGDSLEPLKLREDDTDEEKRGGEREEMTSIRLTIDLKGY